jgi:uncharacterized cupredoxin-like copper-binding protein
VRRAAVLVLLVLAGACSSNEQPLVAPSGSAGVVTPSPTVKGTASFVAPNFTFLLTMHNDGGKFYFDPSTINAPKGSKATVEVRNGGTVLHNLTVGSTNEDVAPGKSTTVVLSFTPPQTKVTFYCKYHKASGMTGTFNLS